MAMKTQWNILRMQRILNKRQRNLFLFIYMSILVEYISNSKYNDTILNK